MTRNIKAQERREALAGSTSKAFLQHGAPSFIFVDCRSFLSAAYFVFALTLPLTAHAQAESLDEDDLEIEVDAASASEEAVEQEEDVAEPPAAVEEAREEEAAPIADTTTDDAAPPSDVEEGIESIKLVDDENEVAAADVAAERRQGLVPGAQAPVGDTIEPRSLAAEGSNFRRPLRRGLSWWGFVQAEYYNNQLSEDQLDPDGHSLNLNQFGIRRARLRIDHGWEYAFATLELDAGTFGGPHVRIRRAEASLLYRGGVADDTTPPLVLTAGVTDVPFGAELAESQRDRLFMEMSLPIRALFPTPADVGVKLWGAYEFLDYAVAVVNGEPLGETGFPSDQNSHKDIAARVGVLLKPKDNLNLTGGLSFYKGKGFHPGIPGTKDSLVWVDANNNGVVDAGEVLGNTGSAPIESVNYDRWAVALDVGASLVTPLGVSKVASEAFLASNLDRGLLPHNPIATGTDSWQFGWSGSVVQQVTDWGALGFRAAFYDPNSNLLDQRAGVFHLRNQTFWVFSPTLAFTLPSARLTAQYDFIRDNQGRDTAGVPTNVANNEFTLRLQVDL